MIAAKTSRLTLLLAAMMTPSFSGAAARVALPRANSSPLATPAKVGGIPITYGPKMLAMATRITPDLGLKDTLKAAAGKIEVPGTMPERDGLDSIVQIKFKHGAPRSRRALWALLNAGRLRFREYYVPDGGDGAVFVETMAASPRQAARSAKIVARARSVLNVYVTQSAAIWLEKGRPGLR